MSEVDFLYRVIAVCSAIISALLIAVVWFVKKERSTIVKALDTQGSAIAELKEDLDQVTIAVFGHNGDDGINGLENKFRNALQPLRLHIDDIKRNIDDTVAESAAKADEGQKQVLERLDKLTIAIARSNPNIPISELR